MNAIAFALQALVALPDLIAAGVQVGELIQTTSDALENMQDEKRDPTHQEWDALNNVIAELRKELHDT